MIVRSSGIVLLALVWVTAGLSTARGQDVSGPAQRFIAADAAVQGATPLRPRLHAAAHAQLVGRLMLVQAVGSRPPQQLEPALRWMSDLLDQRVTLGRDSLRFAEILGTLMQAWSVSDDGPDVIVKRYERMLVVVCSEQPQWPAEGETTQWAAATITLAATMPGSDEAIASRHYRFATTHPLRPALTRPHSEAYMRGPAWWTLAASARRVSIEEVAHSWMELRHGLEQRIVGNVHAIPFEEAVGGLLMAWSVAATDQEKPVVEAGEAAVAPARRAQGAVWNVPFIRSWSGLTAATMIRADSRAAAASFEAIDNYLQSQPLGLPRSGEAYQSLLGMMTQADAWSSRSVR